mmetsp:Transcript_4370/g.7510  ORF Transcript_4370/g.7510 Transcript_4370/m.7510 type:complete len:633 (-) Transcript_4370:75-1973(-)
MTKLVRTLPPLPSTERGVSCQFATDSPGDRVLYCNSSNVIWRPIAALIEGKGGETPEDIFCYRTHPRNTTCCHMSPNSQWVVSGDVTGAIRLWGAKGDHILKNEYKLWNGIVKDVSFSGDSGRIVAAGDGKEVRACAIIWDTGSKTGEVAGHVKQVNSISFRSQRPFRVMTGSEDMTVACYEGPPFKFKQSHTNHTNFVNSVRYSPDGEWAASAGSDSKIVLYEGKTGNFVKEFTKPADMSGSLWALAWSPDSARLATAGGDKKLRVWDRESGAQASEALVGSGALEDMQVGLCWAKPELIVTTCLDGRLLLWDVGADGVAKIATIVDGTQASIESLACDGKTGMLLHGGPDGRVAMTPADNATRCLKVGKTVKHVVTHPGSAGAAEAWVLTLDELMRRVSIASGEFIGEPVAFKEFPVGAGWLDEAETKLLIAGGKNSFHCVSDTKVEWSLPSAVPRRPTAVSTSPGRKVAVALEKPDGFVAGVASEQFDIHLFTVTDVASADGIKEETVLQGHKGEVSALAFSPSGEFLASGDGIRAVKVWNVSEGNTVIANFGGHTARITCLEWLPDGRRLVSGSLDRYVYVWNLDDEKKKLAISEAHKGGVSSLTVLGDGRFASAGLDGFVLVHELAA